MPDEKVSTLNCKAFYNKIVIRLSLLTIDFAKVCPKNTKVTKKVIDGLHCPTGKNNRPNIQKQYTRRNKGPQIFTAAKNMIQYKYG